MHETGSLICNQHDKLMVKMTTSFLLCGYYSCVTILTMNVVLEKIHVVGADTWVNSTSLPENVLQAQRISVGRTVMLAMSGWKSKFVYHNNNLYFWKEHKMAIPTVPISTRLGEYGKWYGLRNVTTYPNYFYVILVQHSGYNLSGSCSKPDQNETHCER